MVKGPSYIPDLGDIVWVSFNPQKGREQANKRPAIVVSPEVYNRKSSLALMCPITSRMKSYTFEVTIKERKIEGVALVDQIRSLDWQARKVKFIERAKPGILFKIQEKILILLTQ